MNTKGGDDVRVRNDQGHLEMTVGELTELIGKATSAAVATAVKEALRTQPDPIAQLQTRLRKERNPARREALNHELALERLKALARRAPRG
jgi:hypothetical protein